jgi:hypothetical protein
MTLHSHVHPRQRVAFAVALPVSLAVILILGVWQPAAGQPVERPTNCQEEMIFGTVFIGHNCGEFASVLISGRIVIERPWSRVNRASRAERLRTGRRTVAPRVEAEVTPTPVVTDAVTVTETDTAADTATDTTNQTETRRTRRDRGSGASAEDIDCNDFTYQDDAQEYFDEQGWSATDDPFGLDDRGVGNGIPCESLPSRRA